MAHAVAMLVDQRQRLWEYGARKTRQHLGKHRDIFDVAQMLWVVARPEYFAMHCTGTVGQRHRLVQQITPNTPTRCGR